MERTLAIVKPDAVGRHLAGEILRRIEAAGLTLSALKLTHLTRAEVERFYEVHKARPFYGSLCEYMSSGPVVIAVLAGDGADLGPPFGPVKATGPRNSELAWIRAARLSRLPDHYNFSQIAIVRLSRAKFAAAKIFGKEVLLVPVPASHANSVQIHQERARQQHF